jgi:putative transferase (TIGR04331 family)
MFLALTADERYWDTRQKILFLGEWCRRYDWKTAWEFLPSEILDYPWNDRAKLYADYRYLNRLYEKVLGHYTKELNALHAENHSIRYWRIVIGPWLYYFIQALYDRYLCLKAAGSRYAQLQTILPKQLSLKQIPPDCLQFFYALTGDAYNQLLYGELIRLMNQIPFTVREDATWNPEELFPRFRKSNPPYFKNILKQGVQKLALKNGIAMICLDLPLTESVRLHRALKQFPMFDMLSNDDQPVSLNSTGRDSLRSYATSDEFEQLLLQVVPRHIPPLYIERFAPLRAKALNFLPNNPKVILTTGSALVANDLVKLWIAEKTEQGSKLATMQHGGEYGCARWNSDEDHEVRVSDRFYSWGWKNAETPNVVPMPATKLVSSRDLPSQREGPILMALMSVPRYSYFISGQPIAGQLLVYLNDQIKFIRELNEAVRPLILCRLYMHEYGWHEDLRLQEAFPSLSIYRGPLSLQRQLRKSRLSIGTYNATAFLETLAANFPTLLFWNPCHWELRPSAQPYFDELRRVGILHDSPVAAATQVNKIYEDPQTWWHQKEIQKVRGSFCDRFAWSSADWVKTWAHEIKELATQRSPTVAQL